MSHKGNNISPLKITVFLVKVLLLVFAARYIYRQIFIKQDVSLLMDQLNQAIANFDFFIFLIPAILLMPLNWFIETKKWQILTSKIEHSGFFTSLKAVLTGLNLGIMTPARIGEFAGRIMYLEAENRVKGIMASFMGSISQLAATLIFGLIAARFILPQNFSDNEIVNYLNGIILLLIPGILLFYFLMNNRVSVSGIYKQNKWQEWLRASSLYTLKTRTIVLFLSFLRYIVFTIQFVLLIFAFGANVKFLAAFFHASLTFLGMTLVPTFALAEAGIRGSIAIEIFGLMDINPLGILSASVALWIINLMIPTLVGMYFLIMFRLKKSE